MSDRVPFELQGNMSQVDACLVVFRALTPGDWVSEQDLHAQVCELTGTDVAEASLYSASWQARERLPKNGELGVEAYMGGFKRLTTVELAQAAEVRLTRAIRDLGRMDTRVNASLRQPDLPAPWQHRMQQLQSNQVKQAALSARRQNRHRPLPAGDAA